MQAEIETKFDVSPDFVMPALALPEGRPLSLAVDTVPVLSTYYDTADGDLLRSLITLRRRGGGADTGWQLKVPAGADRNEWHWPAGGEPAEGEAPILPDELVDVITPFIGDTPVLPAVRLEVTRTRHRISDETTGELLAEIADDEVRAIALGAVVRAPRWREVEVELGPGGDREMLTKLGQALLDAGAYSSTSRSKFARAQVGIGNEGLGTPRTSAGAVLTDYITAQARAIVGGHFDIHAAQADAVHKTRVGVRRLRSTLHTFRACFDEEQAIQFEGELKWWADELGRVRDDEVMLARLNKAVDMLTPDLIVGPVAVQIKARLGARLEASGRQLLQTMRQPRYAQLLGELARWRADPPFTAAAGRPARTLDDAVHVAQKRLNKRLAKARRAGSTDEEMHTARKSGKKVRYAAEAAAQTELAGQAEQLQELLGEFHDSVVAIDVLKQLAQTAAAAGEETFTYGVLVTLLQQDAAEGRRAIRKTHR